MTILETIPILEQPGNYISITLFSLASVVTLFLISGAFYANKFYTISGIFAIGSIISLIIFIIGIILSVSEPKIDTGRKQYIVRINNEITLNEFYDQYKIIDHVKYSDIYTVEELNQND